MSQINISNAQFHSAKEQKNMFFTLQTKKMNSSPNKTFSLHINFYSFLVCCVKCSPTPPRSLNYYSKLLFCSISFLSFN